MGKPAYHVFPDRTLEELARVLPKSPAALLEIRGIGPDALAVIAKQRG